MGCISSELCYLQGVTELKVIWHPTQRPPLTALFWGGGLHCRNPWRETAWSWRHQSLESSAVLGKPVQPEEEIRAEERGSDLVFLPPFPD